MDEKEMNIEYLKKSVSRLNNLCLLLSICFLLLSLTILYLTLKNGL